MNLRRQKRIVHRQLPQRRRLHHRVRPRTDAAVSVAAMPKRVPLTWYQLESKRPIVCLAFVLPMILVYELVSLSTGTDQIRSGIDLWVSRWFEQIGMGHLVVLPLLTLATLIVWHHRIDDPFRFSLSLLPRMLVEACGLGLMLYWAANAVYLVSQSELTAAIPSGSAQSPRSFASVICFVGSGIYEELLFRLVFFATLVILLARLVPRPIAIATAIVLVSVVFAGMHYQLLNPAGTELDLSSFLFRFLASIVFCILFLFRGFGITVGTHVVFDVLTQL